MRPLVIVRPEPAASVTARAAAGLGLDVIVLPLFEVEPIDWDPPDPAAFDGLLVTSANAIRHGGGRLDRVRSLPAYCVGEASAREAETAGFTVAATGTGGVDKLLASIPAGLRLAHLCGADRREPDNPAQSIVTIPVYRSVERDPGKHIERPQGAVVAIHSPRSGEVFARAADAAGIDRARTAIVAISAEAAASAGEGWEAVEIAASPNDAAILALAARLCNKAG